ncbi:MAG: phosphatidate cytidylyltransferase [Bacteroidia bacterium]|jgi:dolichol kinase
MTKTDLLNTAILAGAFLLLFGFAEILYHYFKAKVEITRKIVHFGTGILTLLFPLMLDDHWLVLLLCGSFAVILIISIRYNFLKSVNAIDRESVGSIAYPVSVYGCYLAFNYFDHQYAYFYIPILILAICDPVAALAGKKWPLGKYKIGNSSKTLMGSGMFFLSAFIVIVVLSLMEHNMTRIVMRGLIIALFSTVSEAVSGRGYDNITIPVSVLASLIVIDQLT